MDRIISYEIGAFPPFRIEFQKSSDLKKKFIKFEITTPYTRDGIVLHGDAQELLEILMAGMAEHKHD